MGALLALALAALCLPAAADFDGRWPRQMVSSIGLCRYGGRIDCCWGWARQSWGQCQPVCQPACKHGECVGPNKCKCHPGYAGKICSQDLNECGLQPRPCKHRCMNTWGSYKCYCLSGYMLMPDGVCSGALSCSLANCQYGCDVVKGQVRCQCPSPGLQLAPDGRTCVDIDECALGRASCPPSRQCVNTFGSYVCKCHQGFDLVYIGGKYQCHDLDECSLGQHQCGGFALCHNTPGSYVCRCREGYEADGRGCVYIPTVLIEPSGPIPGPKGGTFKGDGADGHSNHIPDAGSTRWPSRTPYVPPATDPTSGPPARPTEPPTPPPTARPTQRPSPRPTPPPPPPLPTQPRTPPPPPPPTTGTPTPRMTTTAPATGTSAPSSTMDNRIHTDPQKPRGDVFIPRQPSNDLFEVFEIERGVSADDDQGAKDDPGVLIHSCSFDHGLCGWIQEKHSDLHWEATGDPAGVRAPGIPAGAAADAGDPGRGRLGTDWWTRLEAHTHHPARSPRPERCLQGREAARASRDSGAGRREPDPRSLHPGPAAPALAARTPPLRTLGPPAARLCRTLCRPCPCRASLWPGLVPSVSLLVLVLVLVCHSGPGAHGGTSRATREGVTMGHVSSSPTVP